MKLILKSSLPALLLAACFPTVLHAAEKSAPQTCADALLARRGSVNTIVARLNVTVHDLEKKKDHTLHGAYLGDAAGNMRLRITADTGQLVLDAGAGSGQIEICLPGKERYLTGAREELERHPRCELALFAQFGSARDLFFPEVAPSAKAIRNPCCMLDGKIYFNTPDTSEIPWLGQHSCLPCQLRRTVVSASSAQIERIAWYSRAGLCAGQISYADYRVLPADTPGQIPPPYSAHLTFLPAGGNFVLDLTVEDFTLNSVIAPAKFAVPSPQGITREPLSEALEKNVSLWE